MAKTLETSVEISGVLSPSLQAAINNAVSKLDEMSKETLEAAGAAEKLAAEITTQESVLKSLERGYADFVVSGEEGSEEAQQLAQHIQKLSNELDENRDTLEEAQKAAEKLTDSMEDTGSEADRLRKTINQQEDTLQQLKERYAALALSEEDTSDESKELAQQIQKLSSELNDNKQRLSDAEYAANKLDNSLDEVESSAKLADEGFTVFKATLANLAASAIRSAIAGIKQLASNVLELGQNFTHTMSEVQAISGATGDELEKLKATAREYGATTVFSASESAEALKYMALAGWDVEQSTSALGGVLNLAAASGMELGAASDMVTDYLSAFGMEADKAGYFADLLASAQASSNTTAEALGEAYKNCAANLNAAGQDIETVTSMLEGMANQGYKGSQAGTALTAIMRDITNSMENGAISIGDASVTVMDAKGNFRDLTDILKDVEKATDGMGDAEKAAALASTFTANSTKGLNLILNEGIDKIAGYEENLRTAGGAAEEMAAIMNDNLTGDMAQMNSAFEELGLKVYEKFEQPLRNAVKFVTNSVIPAIEWAMGHLPEIGIVLSALSSVIVAMKWSSIAKKLTMVKGALQGVMTALGGISAPILAIIAVVAVLALAFTNLWKNNEEFRNKITAIWENLKGKFEAFGQKITDKLNELGFDFKDFSEVLTAIWNGLCEWLAPIFEGVFQYICDVVGYVLDVIIGLFDFFAGIFTGDWDRVWEGVKEVFGAAWDFVAATFKNWGTTFKNATNVILGWFGTNWDELWGSVKEFFVETWNGIVSFFSEIWNGITSTVSSVLSWIDNFFVSTWTAISSFFSEIWDGISSTVSGALSWIENFFVSTWTAISTFFSDIWDGIVSFLSSAWETIKNVVQVGLLFIKEIFSAAFNLITLPFRFIWENCKDTVLSVWEKIKGTISDALESIKAAISEKLEAAKQVITAVTDKIKDVASKAWNAISSTASSVWETVNGTIGEKITAAQQTVSKVTGKIEEVTSNAWQSVSSTASSVWETVKDTIDEKITAAQQTVSKVTGKIEEVASNAWQSVSSTASSVWDTIKGYISEKITAAQQVISRVTDTITNIASSAWQSISSTASTIWGSIKDTIGGKINAAWSVVSSATSGIWNTVSNALSGAYNTVQSIFGKIYDSISGKIESAKNAVSNAINAIKNLFNFSWSLPKLKLPHFNISGEFSLSPPSVPHFAIDWYKEGGILTKPTVFGAAGNRLLAGGEAGAEAVVPLATLWEKLETMIQSVFNGASSAGRSPEVSLVNKAGELLTLDDFSLGSLAGTGGVMIYYDFSNLTWSPHFQTGDGDTDADDFMARVRAHEAEFVDWLKEYMEMQEVAQYA